MREACEDRLVIHRVTPPFALSPEECTNFADGHCARGARCSFFHPGEDNIVEVDEKRRTSNLARQQLSSLNRYMGLTPTNDAGQRNVLFTRPCNFFSTASVLCETRRDTHVTPRRVNVSRGGRQSNFSLSF